MLKIDCHKALQDFTLDISEQVPLTGLTAIFGPSGAGKSTLLRLISGFETPDKGTISLRDKVLFSSDGKTNIAPYKRNVGYMFQGGQLFPHLTVRGNLTFAQTRSSHIQSSYSFEDIVSAFDLGPLLGRAAPTLSGGERQRAALARTLLSRPAILLLDEPLAGLDRARKRNILPFLQDLPKRFGLPCFYVSHDIEEVSLLADRILILENGRVQAHGPALDILNQIDSLPLSDMQIDPATTFEARVSSQDPKLQMMQLDIGGAFIMLPRNENLKTGQSVRVTIRAQDVSLATSKPKGLSIQNILKGELTELDQSQDNPFVVATIKLSDTQSLKARITRQAVQSLKLSEGQSIYALVKTASLDRGF